MISGPDRMADPDRGKNQPERTDPGCPDALRTNGNPPCQKSFLPSRGTDSRAQGSGKRVPGKAGGGCGALYPGNRLQVQIPSGLKSKKSFDPARDPHSIYARRNTIGKRLSNWGCQQDNRHIERHPALLHQVRSCDT